MYELLRSTMLVKAWCPQSEQEPPISLRQVVTPDLSLQPSYCLSHGPPRPPVPATSKLSHNHADTRPYRRRTAVTGNVVLTPYAKQTPVQIMLRVPAASTRPTASPPAQNVHHSSAKCHCSATTAKRLPCSRDNWLPHALPLPLPAAQRVERPCSSSWPGRA